MRYRVYDRAVADGGGRFSVVGSRDEGVADTVSQLWVEPFKRLRAEQDGREPGQRPGPYLKVVDGQRWWTYSPQWGARYGEGIPAKTASQTITGFEGLLDPRILLAEMRDVVCGGSTLVAGRQGIVVRAQGRDGYEWWVDRELVVDAERGIVLRLVDRFGGEVVERIEFTSVAFDEPFADEVFTFTPPPGEVPLPLPEGQQVSVAEAARVADFTVYVPVGLPEGRQQQVGYWPGWQRQGLPGANVHIRLGGVGGIVTLQQHTEFVCDDGHLDWEHVRGDGDDLLVATDSQGSTHIRVRKGDTSIELWAVPEPFPHMRRGHGAGTRIDIRATALAMAASLAPAPQPADSPAELLSPPSPEATAVPAAPSTPDPYPGQPTDPPAELLTGEPPADLCDILEVLYGRGRRYVHLRATVTQRGSDDEPPTTLAEIAGSSAELDAAADDVVKRKVHGQLASLHDPRPIFVSHDLDVTGSCAVGARSGVRLLATPGLAPLRFPFTPTSGLRGAFAFDHLLGSMFHAMAEKLDLVLDREHAVVLRIRSYPHDETVRTVELAEVAFDEA